MNGQASHSGRKNRIRVGSLAFDVVNYAFMALLCITFVYPMLHVLSVSISDSAAISGGRVSWYPVGLNLSGYSLVFGQASIWQHYWNTIVYAVVGTFINLMFTAMAAYAMHIREFVMRKTLTVFLTITMFFGGGMIPAYLQMVNLKLINTLWAIVLPGAVSAYNVFVYRSFFNGISGELREAAYIDGANDIRILFGIYLPLSKALLATFGLFSLVGFWNSWFSALMYLPDMSKQPIQMLLRRILFTVNASYAITGSSAMINSNIVNEKNVSYACIVATIWPIMIIYPFIQKHFTKGVMVGAIKG